jgi:hypothetical protein
LQYLENRLIHLNGLGIGHAAVHHPVPDADQPIARPLRPQMADQMVECPVLLRGHQIAPFGSFDDFFSDVIGHHCF